VEQRTQHGPVRAVTALTEQRSNKEYRLVGEYHGSLSGNAHPIGCAGGKLHPKSSMQEIGWIWM